MEDVKQGCGGGCGFSFCFWAKLIVAIPALPILGYAVAMQFEDENVRWLAFGLTMLAAVWAAIKIDKMPALQRKFVKRD